MTSGEPLLLEFSLFITLHSCLRKVVYFFLSFKSFFKYHPLFLSEFLDVYNYILSFWFFFICFVYPYWNILLSECWSWCFQVKVLKYCLKGLCRISDCLFWSSLWDNKIISFLLKIQTSVWNTFLPAPLHLEGHLLESRNPFSVPILLDVCPHAAVRTNWCLLVCCCNTRTRSRNPSNCSFLLKQEVWKFPPEPTGPFQVQSCLQNTYTCFSCFLFCSSPGHFPGALALADP